MIMLLEGLSNQPLFYLVALRESLWLRSIILWPSAMCTTQASQSIYSLSYTCLRYGCSIAAVWEPYGNSKGIVRE